MSGNSHNGGDDSPTLRSGDVEKEREIERRLRELGLWENKRRLETQVTSMLEARIDETDALSRTLRNCRRKRSAGVGGRTAIDEIRNIISPQVVRDRYGQRLAYHVDVLMGCFTRDVRHDLVDDVVVISGSTAGDDDPARLTKEIRLELPPDLNMAALRISYAAGAVKIRVPYVYEDLPKSRNISNDGDHGNSDGRQYRFSSISPIYSLNMQLKNRRKLDSGSSEGGSYNSPAVDHVVNGGSTGTAGSNSSPGSVNSETRSLGDDLQLLSPYPVFEEERKEERTVHDIRGPRIGTIPGNDSSRESFDLRSNNATPFKSTDENFINGDYRLKSDDAGGVDSVPLRLGRSTLSPSYESCKFEQPGVEMSDSVALHSEFCGNETLDKSSRRRSTVDSTGSNCKNSFLSNSNFKTSDFNEETNNTFSDYKAETYPLGSSRTTLSSETVDKTFENRGVCRSVDGLIMTDAESNKPPIVRKTKDSSLESNGRDSGTFSLSGRTRSLAEEICSDEDAIATESDFLDSDRSSTNHDRQSVFARINGSTYENGITAKNGRNNRATNATEGTFNTNTNNKFNNNNNHDRTRISPSGKRDSAGLIDLLDVTEAMNGVLTSDIDLLEGKTLTNNGTNQPSIEKSLSSDIGATNLQKRRSGDSFNSADDAMLSGASFADVRSSRARSGQDHVHENSAESQRLTSPFYGNLVAPEESTLLVDIPTHALMSESNFVGRPIRSGAISESKIANVNGTTSLRESDKNVKERSFEMPYYTKFGPAKLNGEEAGGKEISRSFVVKSTSDGRDASGRHQRPTEGLAEVSGSAAGGQSLIGEQHQSAVGQVEGAVRSIGNRTRTKRTRANLNLILDSLDETVL